MNGFHLTLIAGGLVLFWIIWRLAVPTEPQPYRPLDLRREELSLGVIANGFLAAAVVLGVLLVALLVLPR